MDSIIDLSPEEIDSLKDVPGWMKPHLHTYREQKFKEQNGYLTPEEIADRMSNATRTVDGRGCYPAYKYNGSVRMVGGDTNQRGHRMSLEIETGDLFLILPDNVVKINSTSINLNSQQLNDLLAQSEYLGDMGIQTYNITLQDWLTEKHGSVSGDGGDMDTDYSLGGILSRGVKIGR